jgi:hypothetical protein
MGEKIECVHCGYSWETSSELDWICCPNCQLKFKRKKKEVGE